MGASEDSHTIPGFWASSRWLKGPMIRIFSSHSSTLKSVSWICKTNLGPRNSKFRWRRIPMACTSCIRVGSKWGCTQNVNIPLSSPPYECPRFPIFDDYELSSSLDETDSRLQNHSETNDSDRACVDRLPWRNYSRWLAGPPIHLHCSNTTILSSKSSRWGLTRPLVPRGGFHFDGPLSPLPAMMVITGLSLQSNEVVLGKSLKFTTDRLLTRIKCSESTLPIKTTLLPVGAWMNAECWWISSTNSVGKQMPRKECYKAA